MSLFGAVSRVPLRVRTIAANGDDWGFCVDGPEQRLTASGHGGGTVAVHDRSSEWFVSDDTKSEGPRDRTESTGDVVIAAVTAPAEKATLARSVPWVFVYEKNDASVDTPLKPCACGARYSRDEWTRLPAVARPGLRVTVAPPDERRTHETLDVRRARGTPPWLSRKRDELPRDDARREQCCISIWRLS